MTGRILKSVFGAFRRAAAAVRCDLGAHMPAWYLAYQAISIAYTEAKVYVPPAGSLLWTAAFPLAWFYLYRIPLALKSGMRRKTKTLLLLIVPAALLVYSVSYALPFPLDQPTALHYTEIWSFIVFVVLGVHCLTRGGRRKFVHLYVVGLVYGCVLENSGIVLGFFSEEGYRFYIPGLPAPVYTVVGWCTAVYVSVHVTEILAKELGRGGLATAVRTVMATAVALSIDMQVDPAAAYYGWWVWHPDLGMEILGVPAINFIAWFSAMFPFFWAYFWYTSRQEYAGRAHMKPMVISTSIALAAAAVLVVCLTLVLLGTSSAAWRLLDQAFRHPIRTILS